MSVSCRLLSLCMVIFLDALGGGMISPLINPLFFQDQGLIAHMALSGREVLYGVSLGGFFFMAAIGGPFIGMLSDRYGRKRLLVLCIAGSVVGFALSLVAIAWHSVTLFIVGRLLDGLTAGCLGLAQASVADISDSSNKSKYIGYIFLSLSLGFMLAPIFSGLLALIDVSAPFYAVIALALMNVVLLMIFYRETYEPNADALQNKRGMRRVAGVLRQPGVFKLFVTFSLMQLGWSFYMQDIALYLSQRFDFDTSQLSAFLFVVSIGFTVATSLVLPRLSRWLKRDAQVLCGLVGLLVFMSLILFCQTVWMMWVVAAPVAICLAATYSMLNAMISDAVAQSDQGLIMGNIGAVSSLTFGVAALLSGVLSTIALWLPFAFAAVAFAFAVSVYCCRTCRQ